MIVTIDEIGQAGLSRTETIGADALDAWLSEAGEAAWSAAGTPAVFEAAFDKVGSKVLMKGRALAHLTTACRRCLEPVAVELPFEFAVSFVTLPSGTGGAADPSREPKKLLDEAGTGASFDLASADEEPFDGRTIDTAELLREQLLLNLPMGTVCREDCKGLCPVCGGALDERECGCERKPMDPRWEALRAIKLPKPSS